MESGRSVRATRIPVEFVANSGCREDDPATRQPRLRQHHHHHHPQQQHQQPDRLSRDNHVSSSSNGRVMSPPVSGSWTAGDGDGLVETVVHEWDSSPPRPRPQNVTATRPFNVGRPPPDHSCMHGNLLRVFYFSTEHDFCFFFFCCC